jgi:hypothetical protein
MSTHKATTWLIKVQAIIGSTLRANAQRLAQATCIETLSFAMFGQPALLKRAGIVED